MSEEEDKILTMHEISLLTANKPSNLQNLKKLIKADEARIIDILPSKRTPRMNFFYTKNSVIIKAKLS